MRPSQFFTLRPVRWCVGLLLLAACTDPYLPDTIKTPPSYLVVDGFLNAQGVTSIKLSRTYAIGSAAAAPPAETKATAYVEEEAGPRYVLRENAGGIYTSTPLVLNVAKKYRLHLTTQAGQEYASDYVPVKITPPLDNVSWQVDNAGVNVLVAAHDDASATRYYRWETTETWEILPPYRPGIEYVNRVIRLIRVPYPTICWGTQPSTGVLLANTAALNRDVVSDFRVKRLPANSERLNTRYSILVQQYALTKEEYDYWELLRKNTEAIGSLFDPQPAQLTGNVRGLGNPADVALGYVGAHSLAEKRIFIRRAELPNARDILTGYEKCVPPDTVAIPPPGVFPVPKTEELLYAAFGANPDFLPIDGYSTSKSSGFLAAKRDCIDCRTRGTAVKPSFWP